MSKYNVIVGVCLVMAVMGCRQPANTSIQPMVPMNPLAPFAPQTRIAPPPTGSYSVPGGYYQGQASAAPAAGSPNSGNTTQVAQSNSDRSDAVSPNPVGSGLGVTELQSSLPAWTEQSPRYSSAAASNLSGQTNVSPAVYVTAGPSGYSTPPTTSAADSGLGPQLRGMQPQELASSSTDNLTPATRTDSANLPWQKPLER